MQPNSMLRAVQPKRHVCLEVVAKHNKLSLLEQMKAYLVEAVLLERQPAVRAWHSLCCGDFAGEVLPRPTAEFIFIHTRVQLAAWAMAMESVYIPIQCWQCNDGYVQLAVCTCLLLQHAASTCTYLEPLILQKSISRVAMHRRKSSNVLCFLRCRCYSGSSCPFRISINLNLDLYHFRSFLSRLGRIIQLHTLCDSAYYLAHFVMFVNVGQFNACVSHARM